MRILILYWIYQTMSRLQSHTPGDKILHYDYDRKNLNPRKIISNLIFVFERQEKTMNELIDKHATLILAGTVFLGSIVIYATIRYKRTIEELNLRVIQDYSSVRNFKNELNWLDQTQREYAEASQRHDNTLEDQLFYFEQNISDIEPLIFDIEGLCIDMGESNKKSIVSIREKFDEMDKTINQINDKSLLKALEMVTERIDAIGQEILGMNDSIESISVVSQQTESSLELMKRAYGL